MESRHIAIEVPLDLKSTLRPLHGHFADDGWWLTARTADGPGSLRVTRTRDELVGEAWGAGRNWLLDRLATICGMEDRPDAFATDDPVVAPLHRRNPGLRFGRTELVFDSLLVAITGQKVTGKEAALAIQGLYRQFSDPAPGPDDRLMLPPDPARMARAPYWIFHRLHLEKRRADVIRDVAANHVRIDGLSSVSPAEARTYLLDIPGIGEWSVAETLAPSHGDPDQVNVGDFHAKHSVVYHLTGRPRGTDEEMVELLEPFRPHRGRVLRLLHRLGHAPKFGPRATPRDITRI